MKKILVIGLPGSGKSVFSKKLALKFNYSLYHLDMLFWNSDETHCSKEEFKAKIKKVIDTNYWIIDGLYSNTLKERIEACDTIFFLDYSLDICLDGIRNRIGKKRDDMPWVEKNFSNDFYDYIIEVHKKEIPEIRNLLNNLKNKNVIIFKTREEANNYLNSL